jgi:geranylgeranyl pyrophosphate synthase
VLEDREFTRVSPEQILELVRAEGTLEEVGELAEQYAARARRELDPLPLSPAREALELAPDFVLYRRS